MTFQEKVTAGIEVLQRGVRDMQPATSHEWYRAISEVRNMRLAL